MTIQEFATRCGMKCVRVPSGIVIVRKDGSVFGVLVTKGDQQRWFKASDSGARNDLIPS